MKKNLLLLLLLSHFSRVQFCATPQAAAHQAPPSLDSPGKNTGVGCHFFSISLQKRNQKWGSAIQIMQIKKLSLLKHTWKFVFLGEFFSP